MTESEEEEAFELLQNILSTPAVNGLSDESELAEYLLKHILKCP